VIDNESFDPETVGGGGVWHFRLYVAGQSPKSLRAIANLKTFCDSYLAGCHEIEIVDLVTDPELARKDDILAIPTLVLVQPTPVRKVVGDLSNTQRVLAGLRIPATSSR
jgi:circadian clock protein KaiB